MDAQKKQYVKMTETPVSKLIVSLGIPTTISMLITNIYNMADTYFVSQISIAASGATGIVFSLMAILQAFGFMYGHGSGSNISRMLGAKKSNEAIKYASTAYFVALITGILIGVLGLIFITPLMKLLGSTATILPEAKKYGFFILISGPAFVCSCVCNNILRYEGKAAYAMVGLTLGGVLNMILDPIFIFTLNMGISGAGLSTALSQYISLIVLMWPFYTSSTVTTISLKYVTRKMSDVVNICYTGASSFLRQGLNTCSSTFLNIQAAVYGDAAIAAMSVVSRCGNLLFSLALGLAQGFQPVSGYNYGAAKYDRVKKATYFTIVAGIGTMLVLCGICYINAEQVIMLFRKETEIVSVGSTALRYLCMLLWTLPVTAVGSMLFQAIGESKKALLIAGMQSGFIFIPLVLILPRFIGLTGIQIAQPLSYFISALITLPMIIKFFKQLTRKVV